MHATSTYRSAVGPPIAMQQHFSWLQILNQFPGGLEPDLLDMQRYAAWKAADIRKAIREGRKPTAGPPGGEDQPINGLASGESRWLMGHTDSVCMPYFWQCKQTACNLFKLRHGLLATMYSRAAGIPGWSTGL